MRSMGFAPYKRRPHAEAICKSIAEAAEVAQALATWKLSSEVVCALASFSPTCPVGQRPVKIRIFNG